MNLKFNLQKPKFKRDWKLRNELNFKEINSTIFEELLSK